MCETERPQSHMVCKGKVLLVLLELDCSCSCDSEPANHNIVAGYHSSIPRILITHSIIN